MTSLVCPGAAKARCDEVFDLSQLARFENLTTLDLSDRCIVDVEPLAALSKLEHLELRGNQIKDLRPLGALARLRTLGLAGNPIESTWRFKTEEPFSRFSQLEELNLDETRVTNILPLGAVSSLRVLHLRSAFVGSLRPLRTLTKLRELHVDDNDVEDLTPLRELLELEELSANRNFVWSIETLHHLAAKGRLRRASLDVNCVSDCDPFEGATFSCESSGAGCVGYEELISPATAMAVPFRFIEADAPTAALPFWSEEQIESAFSLMQAEIRWSDPQSECDARARAAAALLRENAYPELTKVWALGNLRPLMASVPAGFLSFDWHVAPAVRTVRGIVVLDPAFEPRPVTLREWFARMVDSKDADLNFSCRDYWNGQSASVIERICARDDGTVRVDARGDLVVDELDALRGAVCRTADCS